MEKGEFYKWSKTCEYYQGAANIGHLCKHTSMGNIGLCQHPGCCPLLTEKKRCHTIKKKTPVIDVE
jgi:hypothetical protein